MGPRVLVLCALCTCFAEENMVMTLCSGGRNG